MKTFIVFVICIACLLVSCGEKEQESTQAQKLQKLKETVAKLEGDLVHAKEKKELEEKIKVLKGQITKEEVPKIDSTPKKPIKQVKAESSGKYKTEVKKLIQEYQKGRSGLGLLMKKFDKGEFKDNWDSFEIRWNEHVKIRQNILAKLESLRTKSDKKSVKYHDRFIDVVTFAVNAMTNVADAGQLSESRKKLSKDSAKIGKLFKQVLAYYK